MEMGFKTGPDQSCFGDRMGVSEVESVKITE